MQKAYIVALYELLQKDKRVCSLLSDSGTEYDEMMFREFPAQCFNFGIAEENKVASASGMAYCGKIPFVYTTGAFLAYRCFEFIRDDICFQNKNVKIVGMGSGLAWSTLGPSHHTTEDIAVLRALPNIVLLSPASPFEVKRCVQLAYELDGPVYVRIGMSNEKEIYDSYEECSVELGKNVIVRDGDEAVIFCTGSIIEEVLEAADLLQKSGITVGVVNVPCIKPLDYENIIHMAQNCIRLYSVEEHNVIGGLGSAISEVLSEEINHPVLRRIGLQDCFAVGYGSQKEVRRRNSLDGKSLYNIILQDMKEVTYDYKRKNRRIGK